MSTSCCYLASTCQQQSVEERAGRYKIHQREEISFALNFSFFRALCTAPHLGVPGGHSPVLGSQGSQGSHSL